MKKMLSLLFVVIMLTMPLTACGEKDDQTNETTTVTTEGSGEDDSRENAVSSLPAGLNFNGTMINIYSRDREDLSFELMGDSLSSSALSKAVYTRNISVEENLGVKLNVILGPGSWGQKDDFMANIRNNVAADSDDKYDIIAGANYSLVPLMIEGIFTNLLDADYIDEDKPWWNNNFIKETTYKDKLFIIEGEISLTMIDGAFVMYFNKEMLKSYHPDIDLYQTVTDRKWNFELLKTLVKDTWNDTDGDGEKTSADSFGLVSPAFSCGRDGFTTAFGATVTKTDAQGDITANFATERNGDIWLDFYNFLTTENGVFENGNNDGARDEAQSMFISGKAMFITELLHFSWSLPQVSIDYGVIPLPMYDENQTDYGTKSEAMHSQFSITKYSTKRQASAAVLEDLCFRTYKDVTMTYYDKTMKSKNMGDQQSVEMLDIIVGSITCNFGDQFSSALTWPFPVIGTEKDITSFFSGKTTILNIKLPELLKAIENNND